MAEILEREAFLQVAHLLGHPAFIIYESAKKKRARK